MSNQRSSRRTEHPRRAVKAIAIATATFILLAACSSDSDDEPALAPAVQEDTNVSVGRSACPTLRLATHDSFAISEEVIAAFTDDTCIGVEQIAVGDAGQLVSSAILTKDNPTADVIFGIDNTFLQRALDEDLFLPYTPAGLDTIDESLLLDPEFRVTPIDFSDVCANYWTDALAGPAPQTLDDLTDPVHRDQLVVQHPETSSPGFAFLLATVARYGDGWEDYWRALVDNGVAVTPGWTEAYTVEFIAGGGDRSIVVSYATSPPAELLFADPPVDTPPTAVLYDSCFRQIEFAGIVRGTTEAVAAQKLVDFMLSREFQEDIPLNMFVYPANNEAELPSEFVEFGQLAENPATLSPAEIEANREAWTDRWVEIVLG